MTEMVAPEKVMQIKKFCEDALDATVIVKAMAQDINCKNTEVQENIKVIIKELSFLLPYGGEETMSILRYPYGFCIRDVAEQGDTLHKLFPGINNSHIHELVCGLTPEWAEGWAVIPKIEKVGTTYHDALENALSLIAKNRKFTNWAERKLTERHWHLQEKTLKAHAKLNEQPGDFWVFPFQFGKKWAGHSIRNALVRFENNEFALGPYEVAILLLTHPDLITGPDHLYIDCPGYYEYSPTADNADDNFSACSYFRWDSCYTKLVLCYGGTNTVAGKWGVPSGSLP